MSFTHDARPRWRRQAAASVLPLLMTVPAHAHVVDAQAPGPGWTLDPWIGLPLALLALLHAFATLRAWRQAGPGRGIAPGQAALFAAGLLVLALALISPLDALGEELLVAHVAQHMLLLVAAPPLLLLGRPGVALAWTMPRWIRPWAARLLRRPALRALCRPGVATLLQWAVMLAWLAPGAMTLALRDDAVHAFMHFSLLAAGLLFWAAMLARSAARGAALVALLASAKLNVILGALLAFASRAVYGIYAGRGAPWGLGLLEDQQLAGAFMMIGAPMMYLLAALLLLARGLGQAGPIPREIAGEIAR